MYVKMLSDLYNGTWTKDDMWWLMAEKASILGGTFEDPINPKFVPALRAVSVETADLGKLSAYDLVMKRYDQMKKGADVFDPFSGPISDNTGNVQIKAGARASKGDLMSIMYYVDNVAGEIPK